MKPINRATKQKLPTRSVSEGCCWPSLTLRVGIDIPPDRGRRRCRKGALAVEAAFVIPIFVSLLLGIVIGGIGVFQYQQTACLAREASRWASVHGADYQKATNLPAATKADIWAQAVLPLAVSMDTTQLTMSVQWVNNASNQAMDWDAAPKDVRSLTPSGEYVTNTVLVTITYPWNTGLFGNVTLTSVSAWPMSF